MSLSNKTTTEAIADYAPDHDVPGGYANALDYDYAGRIKNGTSVRGFGSLPMTEIRMAGIQDTFHKSGGTIEDPITGRTTRGDLATTGFYILCVALMPDDWDEETNGQWKPHSPDEFFAMPKILIHILHLPPSIKCCLESHTLPYHALTLC
jgi:hypothetical protein